MGGGIVCASCAQTQSDPPPRNDYFSCLTQIASRVSCLWCWWLWAATTLWKRYDGPCDEWWEICAHVFFSCTPHPHPLHLRCIKRATGHWATRPTGMPWSHPPLLTSETLRSPPRRFARFCLRTKVQWSKRSCSCHQIRCDCKFSSWQFFEPRPRVQVVVGQQDGVIKRVLYLFTPPTPHPPIIFGLRCCFPCINQTQGVYCSSSGKAALMETYMR